MNDCPACGEGTLTQKTIKYYADWLGKEIPLRYSVCDHCGSELADREESAWNKRVANEAKIMKYEEIFKEQILQGATDKFFYGIERKPPIENDPSSGHVEIVIHKGSLEEFPNFTFVRMLSNSIPLFKDRK